MSLNSRVSAVSYTRASKLDFTSTAHSNPGLADEVEIERVQQSHGFQFWDSNHIFLYLLREWNESHISLKWTRTLSSASLLPCGQVNICEAPLPLCIQEQLHWVLMGMKHSLWGSKSAALITVLTVLWQNSTMSWGKGGLQLLVSQLSPGHSGGQDQWVTWRSPGNKWWG